MSQIKPHLHYLIAKTPAETILDFKKSSVIFLALYLVLSIALTGVVYYAHDMLELKVAIPSFLCVVLLFGITILPKIHEISRLLNDKGVIDIAPALLVSLQFILNLTLTAIIIPIFLWSKCKEIERRRPRNHSS